MRGRLFQAIWQVPRRVFALTLCLEKEDLRVWSSIRKIALQLILPWMEIKQFLQAPTTGMMQNPTGLQTYNHGLLHLDLSLLPGALRRYPDRVNGRQEL